MAVSKLAGLFLCLVVAVSALPTQEEPRGNAIQTENDLLDSIYNDCMRKDSMSCLKYKLFNFVDKMLGHRDSITVTDGVQIVKTGGEKEGAPRAITSEDTIESLIYNRIAGFLETHTIKVDIKGSEIVNAVSSTARSLGDMADSLYEEEGKSIGEEEGRGKKKKGNRLMGPLMAAIGLKAALLTKLALGAIALIAGKALLIGKIALVLSAIIGLKKLLGQNQGKHVTYEVVAHPQHSSSHVQTHEVYGGGSGHGGGFSGDIGGGGYSGGASSGHGGWGRSLDAQSLAYRGHAQAQA
ncbi:hypothetical protein NQ315_000503 [Exocentrus adspersus]|uniref:Osiris 7 n=1 Tax=Exocentrus adspersus TaxID=1586481 RepID=A0AAV8VA40_9CUCU|nr:hypothetical protein NQ315_000503 [Exocentrus adspersus]